VSAPDLLAALEPVVDVLERQSTLRSCSEIGQVLGREFADPQAVVTSVQVVKARPRSSR